MLGRGLWMGLLAAVALGASPAGALATPAPAVTIAVNDSSSDAPLSSTGKTSGVCESTDAAHGCTLRAAVELANAQSAGEVTIEVPAGTFTNTTANGGSLSITTKAHVTIAGAGSSKTILDGGGAGVGSVITIGARLGTGWSLTVQDVTIRDGDGVNGGAIRATHALLTIDRSTISNNTATNDGGGVFAAGASVESGLTIEQSTIAHNTAGKDGGGIFESDLRVTPIVNSTIVENHAGEYGGGVYTELVSGTLSNDTLLDNTSGMGTSGNLDVASDSEVVLNNTIVAEAAGSRGPGCASDEFNGATRFESEVAAVVSAGYNLDYPRDEVELEPGLVLDACDFSAATHDLVGIDPRLDPTGLKDNGGPTETVALLGPLSGAASPAIDAVPASACVRLELPRQALPSEFESAPLIVDQRGAPRPDPDASETSCDIGAYEFSPTTVTPTCTTPPTVTPGQPVTIVCTIEKGSGLFATGTTATFMLPSGSKLDSVTPSQGTCSGTQCTLGTIDPATITFVLSPSSGGTLGLTATDIETGSKSTSTPVSVAKPTIALSPGQMIALAPAPKQCASLRHFRIHIQNVKVLKVVVATIYMKGRRRRVLRGRALSTGIDLRGLPKETFTVRIVARTASGRRLTGGRTYHTCVLKLPGHRRLFL